LPGSWLAGGRDGLEAGNVGDGKSDTFTVSSCFVTAIEVDGVVQTVGYPFTLANVTATATLKMNYNASAITVAKSLTIQNANPETPITVSRVSVCGASAFVVTVVFADSFADYKPRHCGSWFYDFDALSTVEGIKNLDTSAATSLAWMFGGCECLTTSRVATESPSEGTRLQGAGVKRCAGCHKGHKVRKGDTCQTPCGRAGVCNGPEVTCSVPPEGRPASRSYRPVPLTESAAAAETPRCRC